MTPHTHTHARTHARTHTHTHVQRRVREKQKSPDLLQTNSRDRTIENILVIAPVYLSFFFFFFLLFFVCLFVVVVVVVVVVFCFVLFLFVLFVCLFAFCWWWLLRLYNTVLRFRAVDSLSSHRDSKPQPFDHIESGALTTELVRPCSVVSVLQTAGSPSLFLIWPRST